MSTAGNTGVRIIPSLIPAAVENRLIVGTLEALRRAMEDPATKARLDAEAAEIRMERMMANGGK